MTPAERDFWEAATGLKEAKDWLQFEANFAKMFAAYGAAKREQEEQRGTDQDS